MTEPLVLALLTKTAPGLALAAGFEEEGVPVEVVVTVEPLMLRLVAGTVTVPPLVRAT